MYKHSKISLFILLAILLTFFSSPVIKVFVAEVPDANDIHLVLDSLNYNNMLPEHFRKSSDLKAIESGKTLNLISLLNPTLYLIIE